MAEKPKAVVELAGILTVKEMADSLGISAVDVIKELMKNGIMANINQQIDYDTAAVVASDLGFETREKVSQIIEATSEDIEGAPGEAPEQDPEAIPRPPVVTVMGHVDHGKTKLLDAIRQTNVVAGEAGGITQHIGAYQVEIQGKKITFLDTPGHAAFTAMRARGAQVTDIAILVVAADDGVMPQTQEAISHIKAAKVPIIVALNKIDKEGANPDRVKQQLADAGLLPEDWGGNTPVVEVSAKEKLGIDDLLEMILLVAEVAELKANPMKLGKGTVVEAEMDRSRGPSATVLVQNGTLNLRDNVVVGAVYGRVKAMFDDKGKRIRRAEPATPVVILGLIDVPEAGDNLIVVSDDRLARALAEQNARDRQRKGAQPIRPKTLEEMMESIKAGQAKELPLIVKADVQGSVGAIQGSMEKISTEQVGVNLVHQAVGGITESDVMLASTSGAIIVGFNVRPDAAARRAAEKAGVDIRYYNIIYNLIDDIKAAMTGLLDPTWREVTEGEGNVRAVFRLPKGEAVAGIVVSEGKVTRNSLVRVLRGGTVVHDGQVASLKRFKDDVREVTVGYECGLGLQGFNDFQEGDSLEFYRKEQVKGVLAE
jgi:translation initiation factor IF-2